MKTNFISIDFGTSSSAVAIMKNNLPVLATPLMADAAGSKIFPTTAYVDVNGVVYPCHKAELQKIQDLSRYIREFKLEMTSDSHSFLPISYVDIASSILEHLKESAENSIGNLVEKLVLTIPALYDNQDVRKGVMKQAAIRAGFREDGILFLNEAEAAAIYYDYIRGGKESGLTLVYDLGGGTFDPSLIKHTLDKYELLGNGLGIEVGGKFFTEKIIRRYKKHINFAQSTSLAGRIKENNRLAETCEGLKRTLSFSDIAKTADYFEITKVDFETDISNDIDATLESCAKLINDCGKTWAEINTVLLIGGSCAIPLVRRRITEYCQAQGSQATIVWKNNYGGSVEFDPQFAVALGGAIFAKNKFSPPPSTGYIQYVECGDCKNHLLEVGVNTIGRWHEDNKLSLSIKAQSDSGRKMSRKHCSIRVEFDEQHNVYKYFVNDAGSVNGTFIQRFNSDGQMTESRIAEETRIESGDKIRIGAHILDIFF